MFSLQDFPIGSYFYWIRRLNPKEVVVYSRFKITEHDEDGNLLSDALPENHLFVNSNAPEYVKFKAKHPEGFTIVHAKDKYQNYNPHNMIIPEALYNIYHFPDKLPNTPLSELQKLLGSGLGEIDNLIKEAKTSFEEWNADKGHKTVVTLKHLKNIKPGQEVVVSSPPPYVKKI